MMMLREERILLYHLEFHMNILLRRVLVDPLAQRQVDTTPDHVDELCMFLDRILEMDVHRLEYLTTIATNS
jgi:hypothetical protein